jgi:hypothetical protein
MLLEEQTIQAMDLPPGLELWLRKRWAAPNTEGGRPKKKKKKKRRGLRVWFQSNTTKY